MIILNNVSKNYSTQTGSVTALQHVNLHVKAGEIVGIIGKSGAGKSTLIRCVNVLERPTSGSITVDKQEVTRLNPSDLRSVRRKIGMIFQHFNLLSSRTVYDNIALPLELEKKTKKEIALAVEPLLELTGLVDKKKAYPSQLSGGQKQRVAIARALACQPHVLLSDEATSALDPETTTSILELLKNIRDALQLTILLITHEMSVIKACCDRVGILDHGKLVEESEVGTFFASPQTAIAKNFIHSSLPQKLPDVIAAHVLLNAHPDTHPILRMWFFDETSTQPIISQLVMQFGLQINILQANVEHIKQHIMGTMILAVSGDAYKLDAVVQYLKSIGVHVEVLGYVPNNVITFS